MTTFRDRIEAAVEAREPLDTDEFLRLAATAGAEDRTYWRGQTRLDEAIAAWGERARRSSRRRAIGRRAAAMLAATAAGVAAAWLTTPAGPPMPAATATASGPTETITVTSADEPDATATEPIAPRREPLVAPLPPEPDRFAQAAVTAERLAYAFEPVGQQVGTVVRFLVDAVPGADVFSM